MKTDKSIERLYRKATTLREVDDIFRVNIEKEDDVIDGWKLHRYAVQRTEEILSAGTDTAVTNLPPENRYRACANIAQLLEVDDDYQLIDRFSEMGGGQPATARTNARRVADRAARYDELRAAGIVG